MASLGFGMMRLPMIGDEVDYEQTSKMVDYFLENGFNYFDTAYIYPGSEATLGEILEKNGVRDKVYIANILKCRPPKNRDPLEDEAEVCIEYLRHQVRLIKPEIIVCLGRVAATRLIKEDFKVTKEHGEFFEKKGIYMVGTFHPSALLRTPGNKIKAFEDFQKIRNKAMAMGIL